MTVDHSKHRSRRAWPEPLDPDDLDDAVPPHKHSRVPLGIAYVAIVLLLVTNVLLVIGWLNFNDYVHGKGDQRDQENARLNQRINDAICDLLDQLPEGGLLDRPREKYGCGPGIPIADLPPDVQAQLRQPPTPPTVTVLPAQPSVEPPAPTAPLGQAPPPDSRAPLPEGAGPVGTAEPPPPSPPLQIRELLCDALLLCPEPGAP